MTPLGGSPGATRSIPSLPFEKMLLDRMLLPVPDCDRDPGQDVEGDRVAGAGDGPADRVAGGVVLTITPLTSLPSGALPGDVGADQLPATRLPVAPAPSSRTPQWLAEIRFWAGGLVPPMVLPRRPGDRRRPPARWAWRARPDLVGADQVAGDEVPGRRGAR